MAQPPTFSSGYDYSTLDTNIGTQLDVDMASVKDTLDVLNGNIDVIQNDDTTLGNNTVHPQSLQSATLALFASTWNMRGDWVALTDYVALDSVVNVGRTYVCHTDHTAGATFSDTNWAIVGASSGDGALDEKTTTGTSTAFVLTFTVPYTSLADFSASLVTFHVDCGVSPTLNVDGLGATAIKMMDKSGALVALTTDDIQSDRPYIITQDGTDFIVMNDRLVAGYTKFDDSNVPFTATEVQTAIEASTDIAELASFKNKLINPFFDIDQRDTATTPITADGYSMDRWGVDEGDGAMSVARQTHTIGDSVNKYYFQHDRTGASSIDSKPIYQRIEGVRTLQGKNATVTFRAKAGSTKTLKLNYEQNFGTGGSPSTAVTGTAQTVSLTSSWQDLSFTFSIPSISAKSLGSVGDDYLEIYLEEDSSYSTFTLDIEAIQIEEGSASTEYERRPVTTELSLCYRYLYRINGLASMGVYIGTGFWQASTLGMVAHHLPTQLRVPPTLSYSGITAYDTGGASTPSAISISGGLTAPPMPTVILLGVASSSEPPGHGLYLRIYNVASGFYELDSEL